MPTPGCGEPRALLHHLLEHGDIVGKDSARRMVIQVAVDDHALHMLISFDADDLEDQGNDEPDADDEEDGSPSWCELVLPKVIRRRRAMARPRSGR